MPLSEEGREDLALEFDALSRHLFQTIRSLGTVRARYPGLKGARMFTELWDHLQGAYTQSQELSDHIRIHEETDWRQHPSLPIERKERNTR
jgi:hypothetical protein